MEFKQTLKQRANQVESLLKEYMPSEEGYQKTIMESMNYSLSAGGKRLRPILTMEACKVVGGNVEDAIPFAMAIEMIHTYSLIHDDLPALDNDDLRRGKKTNHIVYGEDMAILAGDALLNYAFEVMLSNSIDKENPNKYLKAINEIAKTSGIYGMIGGQVVDIQSENKQISKEMLDYIHNNKTAAIIIGCMRAGAIIGDATQEQLEKIKEASKDISIFQSYNTSFGVQMVTKMLRQFAKEFYDAGYDIEILEKHHNQKIDAPSGTAELLYEVMAEEIDGVEACYDRSSRHEKRKKEEIGIQSLRGGTIFGEHTIMFAGVDEIIEIKHTALSKEVFVQGAISAAYALNDKDNGLFTLKSLY